MARYDYYEKKSTDAVAAAMATMSMMPSATKSTGSSTDSHDKVNGSDKDGDGLKDWHIVAILVASLAVAGAVVGAAFVANKHRRRTTGDRDAIGKSITLDFNLCALCLVWR